MNSIGKIIDNLKSAKHQLYTDFNINEIGVFGSYSRNEQNENSDIDILIDLEKEIGLIKFLEIENCFKDIVGDKAEVVLKSDLRTELKEQILKETIFI